MKLSRLISYSSKSTWDVNFTNHNENFINMIPVIKIYLYSTFNIRHGT